MLPFTSDASCSLVLCQWRQPHPSLAPLCPSAMLNSYQNLTLQSFPIDALLFWHLLVPAWRLSIMWSGSCASVMIKPGLSQIMLHLLYPMKMQSMYAVFCSGVSPSKTIT